MTGNHKSEAETPRTAADPFGALTDRERSVARLLADGLSYKEVAAQLGISPHTVNTHVKAILRKLKISGSRRLASLVFQARAAGNDIATSGDGSGEN